MSMAVYECRNVNSAFHRVLQIFPDPSNEQTRWRRETRSGTVFECPHPVATVYHNPMERVLFLPERDANPFFHLMEALWMLAGRNDVSFPAFFASQIREYSDDGKTLHGAYGHRWRAHFDRDQLLTVINQLKENPTDRRVVLQMWDPRVDQDRPSGKDVPCNLTVLFRVIPSEPRVADPDRLDMTVFCRSNDAIWGAYGANAVHFSFLQEYVASALGLAVGHYHQISNNLHVYVNEQFETCLNKVRQQRDPFDPYAGEYPPPIIPLIGESRQTFDGELAAMLSGNEPFLRQERFLWTVAKPMWESYKAWRGPGDFEARGKLAWNPLGSMPDCDWRRAALSWLDRHYNAAKAKHEPRRY